MNAVPLIRRCRLAVVFAGFAAGWLAAGCSAAGKAPEVPQATVVDAGAAIAPATERAPVEGTPWVGKPGTTWAAYDKLVNEQRFEEASKEVERVLGASKDGRNGEDWTRALIRWVQLRTALHGYETAVRFLREQPWPGDLLGRTVTELYYADALVQYARMYSWEVGKREKVDTKGVVDLKAWTSEQIHAEALRAYKEVWGWRDGLGTHDVAALVEYVEPNTYPAGIRPTLRDAVTYLLVDLLADTAGWRPEQSNEVYRLDLGALLGDCGAGADLADPAVHPLVKTCQVLADLETWHQAAKRPEAAFEARLERLRRLHDSFTQEPDRARIRADLTTRLAAMKGRDWWAMGMATLAGFVQAESAPDHVVRAHAIARECVAASPGTVGGQRCLAIAAAMEAPDLQFEGMSSDAPGKPALALNARNLDAAYLRVFPFDLVRHIESADDWNLLPDWNEAQKAVKGKAVAEFKVPLAATPDFQSHRTFAKLPDLAPGYYLVAASARPDFRYDDNRILAVPMAVGDLVMQTRQDGLDVEVVVLSGETGRPVEGADVSLYRYDWRTRHKVAETKRTGADGTVHLGPMMEGQSHFVLARKGRDVAIDPNWLSGYRTQKVGETSATLIYTDRAIYRPMQKVLWKAVVYKGHADQADYRTAPATPVSITLQDPNGQVVETVTVTTNRHGTASGEFSIPTGRLLGQWQVRAAPNGWAQIRVEEYKRPTFEAKIKDPESPLRLNQPATLKGEVRYYFGLPVTNGVVKWQLKRTPIYPWWWGWWGGSTQSGQQVVADGRSDLVEDGTFTMSFTPKADERVAKPGSEVSFRYEVNADATDEGGETRSATRAFRLGFTAVEASVRADAAFFRANEPGALSVVRTDLDGTPAKGAGSWRLARLAGPREALLPADQPMPEPPAADGPKALRTPGDRQRERWNPGYDATQVLRMWADGDPVASGKLEHDDKGEAKVVLPALGAGAYRLTYETADAWGAKFTTTHEFLVAGARTDVALPALLLVEQGTVRVGGTARILVLSGLRDQPMTLEFWRDGKRTERRAIDPGAGGVIEIPVAEKDRGGFGVSLTAERDHQWMHFQASVFVPWDDRQLKVAFATFRDRLRPGQSEKWTVKVTGPAGRDAAVSAAEVLAYMYDRSLDAFAPHHAPEPMSVFPSRGSVGWWRASLGAARVVGVETAGFAATPDWPELRADSLKFQSGYGIGGGGARNYRGGGGMLRMAAMPSAAPPPSPVAGAKNVQFEADEIAVEGSLKLEAAAEKDAPRDKRAGDEATVATGAKAPTDGRAAPAVELRSEFRETAFWQPHLLTGPDGTASIEFTVPDSVTSWNVFVHAVTDDLKSGSLQAEARTVKDLMVRPYLPRFLREGDKADLKVVVNNAGEHELKGTLRFEILDAGTLKSVLDQFVPGEKGVIERPFTAPPGGGTSLVFPVTTPARPGQIAFKVTVVAGDFSDGELRPIPVLPGRMHLAQSRFVTLKGKLSRTMKFPDLAKSDDPSRIDEQMVVTVDAQLFYSVLSALPYLVNYPYECVEQTLNRFLSTGIVSSMYKQYPAVEKMAADFAKRSTQWEQWDSPDPNRKMALEETPWLVEAKGGDAAEKDLINVLDPRITRAQRDGALAKLKKAQTSSGGFPWFPGGPPSPWMTLYVLHAFANGLEFGVEVPREVVAPAWGYLHRYYVDEVVRDMMSHDCCWETVTFLGYTLSGYPDASWTGGVFTDAERKAMLDFGFAHWKQHSPYSKGQLALALKRAGRADDARMVFDSVMDSAKTEEDQGTFWVPEDRSWLWYNDTIESHAAALRTLMELRPDDSRLDGLVLWLFLNKKLNHWKSTRATAEVVYSLAGYLKKTAQLGVREDATVDVGGQRTEFVFEPDRYTGKKNQVVVPGGKIDPAKSSTVTVSKTSPGYVFASATWHFSTEKMPDEDRGDFLKLSRQFFKRVKEGREVTLQPLKDGAVLEPGDEVEVQVSLTAKHPMEYVHLRDPRGAGFEPEGAESRHRWELGIYWYEEIRDSGTNFFFEQLPQGEYTFKYRIRAATAGTFKVAPATVQPMYAPEFTAYSAGAVLAIAAGK